MSTAARRTYSALLVTCTAVTLLWLGLGIVVWIATSVPAVNAAFSAAAAEGGRWAQGVLAAVPVGGPTAQSVLDHGLSLLTLVGACVLLTGRERAWSIRLLALAMIASAGAFNLQAHTSATVLGTVLTAAFGPVLGTSICMSLQVLMIGVACIAYLLALLTFPPGRSRFRLEPVRTVAPVVGVAVLTAAGMALLPLSLSTVVFFGFLVPAVGVVVLPRQVRRAPTATARTQARLLLCTLLSAIVIAVVLVVITALLWITGWSSVVLVDRTVAAGAPGSGEPIALLFWFSRSAGIGIAAAVFVATRTMQGSLWTSERLFSRGLAAGLTAALVGGGYVVVHRLVVVFAPGAVTGANVAATALAAVALLPMYMGIERISDRVLFGSRPTPYRALAGVAELSRRSGAAPDLSSVAEAVGRELGARLCRLTVTRTGLRDRVYTWSAGEVPREELVEVVVRHGDEGVGTIAVDYDAIAGLQRLHLLEDVADGLGAVLAANRFGVELERQLRAALAHAYEIAASRRAVVAEMDAERRRIERDLHDGAQHHLVSLRLALGLVEHQVSTAQYDRARERLVQVNDRLDMAESILAETAMGVSSPLLAELGLVGALYRELGGGQPPIEVDAAEVTGNGRFPHDVESAVYFCCLEAVNNARKHAAGATVSVTLRTTGDRLRFVVRDDGPGWDHQPDMRAPGRGLRNVTARISAVGGRIEIRSAVGEGTTVEGSVPVPMPAPEPAAEPEVVEPTEPSLPAPVVTPAVMSLVDEVPDAVAEAGRVYAGTRTGAVIDDLARRLAGRPEVGIVGPGPERAAMREAFAALARDEEMPGPAFTGLDADPATAATFVFLLRQDDDGEVILPEWTPPGDGAPIHRPAHAIGALLVDGPVGGEHGRAAALACAARSDVRRLCHLVVPVGLTAAMFGLRLTDDELPALQSRAAAEDAAGLSLDEWAVVGAAAGSASSVRAARPRVDGTGTSGLDPVGEQAAVAAIRRGNGATRPELTAALLSQSGLPRLRDLVTERLSARGDVLTARAVLLTLEGLLRTGGPRPDSDHLHYRLDRIRSGAPELAELDLLDALRSGELDVPAEERAAAERLLGAAGTTTIARLGLPRTASPAEVRRAATEELGRWQRHTTTPLVGRDMRRVSDILVTTCARLLGGP